MISKGNQSRILIIRKLYEFLNVLPQLQVGAEYKGTQ